MLRWMMVFLVLAAVNGALAWFGPPGTALVAAKICFGLFLLFFGLIAVGGLRAAAATTREGCKPPLPIAPRSDRHFDRPAA